MNETQFEKRITDWATVRGWKFMHIRDARWQNVVGWPDLFMTRNGLAVALEDKIPPNTATEAQEAWIKALDLIPGIVARVVKPADWDWIEGVLR